MDGQAIVDDAQPTLSRDAKDLAMTWGVTVDVSVRTHGLVVGCAQKKHTGLGDKKWAHIWSGKSQSDKLGLICLFLRPARIWPSIVMLPPLASKFRANAINWQTQLVVSSSISCIW